MCADQSSESRFEGELTRLIAGQQSSGDPAARQALYERLADLECRALIGGATPQTLRKIAEIRFLVGILRDAVRPFPIASLRTVLRLRERVRDRVEARSASQADLDA